MQIIQPGINIPFTRYRHVAVILSTVINVVVLAFLLIQGPRLGVDFAGGTLVHLKFQQRVSIPEIRQALSRMDVGESVIQDFGQDGSNEFLVRLEQSSVQLATLTEKVRQGFSRAFGPKGFEIRRVESVGPKVGEDLRRKAAWSVIASTIMMGIYVAFRFEWQFGLGAVIALVHDVLVTIGALMLASYEFDLTIVAALLTIVGFSVNDTVVICDRIRENMRKSPREKLEALINRSVNETLNRTILTTGLALMVLFTLFFLGGGVIRPFAFSLIVGFISGVYSTIFIATPVILLWGKDANTRH